MKRCGHCGETKEDSSFGKNAGKPDGLSTQCKVCLKATNQKHYQKTKEQHREKRYQSKRTRIERNMLFVRNYLLEHPCVDCGSTDLRVLEFDHLRDKVTEVTTLMWSSSLQAIQDEIEKCEIRCRNCHFIITCARMNDSSWRLESWKPQYWTDNSEARVLRIVALLRLTPRQSWCRVCSMDNLPAKKYAVMMPKRSTFDPYRTFDTREEAIEWVSECLDDGFPVGTFVVYEATISPWVVSE